MVLRSVSAWNLFAIVMLCALAGAVDAQDASAQEAPTSDDAVIEKTEVGATPNSSVYGEKVWFGGQPQEDDFESYADLGVTTVINLRTAQEMEGLPFDEKAVVERAGMRYVHIPMGREEPTAEFIAETLKKLGEAGEGKFLLHCASSNRVGYVWSLFAAKQRGLDEEAAIAEGKAAGMRSPVLEERARKALAKTDE